MIRARSCFYNLRKLPSFGFTTTCNTAFVDHELSRMNQENCIMYRRTCRSLASLKFQLHSFSTSAVMGKNGQLDSDIKMNTKMQHDDIDVSIQVHGNDAIEEGYLVSKYRSKADKSNVLLDEHQITALTELDRLRTEVLSSPFYKNKTPSSNSTSIGDGEEEGYSSIFSFSSSIATAKQSTFSFLKNIQMGGDSDSQEREREQGRGPIIKGVYLHGGVGCGKTFCMDLFFENLPIASKQKVHFHKFMLDVHRKMHEAKMVKRVKGDVLPSVIDSILENGLIICFDEFQVTDVADALILRRLFTGLLDKGAVVIATSNRPPNDLYLNGLQRDLFLPFIDLLVDRSEIISMWDSDTDYRLVQGANKARGVYFIGDDNIAKFDQSFIALTKGSTISKSSTISTQGRSITIPQASQKYKVAKFSFDDLCRQPRGAADYLVIGENFHTVFVERVPSLTMNDINIVRRFIVFVDAMYECHVKLIIHAATKPDEIFKVDLGDEHCDEAFAFDRTRSRLEEMGSDEYLKSRWTGKS